MLRRNLGYNRSRFFFRSWESFASILGLNHWGRYNFGGLDTSHHVSSRTHQFTCQRSNRHMFSTKIWERSHQSVVNITQQFGFTSHLLSKLHTAFATGTCRHLGLGSDRFATNKHLVVESICIRVARSKVGIESTDLIAMTLNKMLQVQQTVGCEFTITRLPRRHDALGMLSQRFPFFPIYRANVEAYFIRLARSYRSLVSRLHRT
ncbi:hypothetical protein D3C86_862170 [compost metagenome]